MTLYADSPGAYGQHHLSLIHGWLPLTVQAVGVIVLLIAVGRRSRRWQRIWLPVCAAAGIALTVAAHWYAQSEGLSGGEPAPMVLWVWIAATGAAAVLLVVGWRGARWWRRGVSVLAVPLSLLCAALALNLWVGYFPTVQVAWNDLTAGPLPDQTDQATVVAMQRARQIPSKGSVVPVTISSAASGFTHRGEFVYLPPAWFASDPAPRLPTLMMIGGEFNTAADWLRAGNAVKTLDDFAAAHHGNAPVLVFVDSGGAFNTDTECVNGARGNSADHLTKDVVPFMEATYGVSAKASNWGVVGWSMGGTCAVDLTVMHPDVFASFEDIAGDIAPNTGTKDQTIARLFGGNAAAYAPSTRRRSSPGTVPIRVSQVGSTSTDRGRHRRSRRPRTAGPASRRQRRIHCAQWASPTESTAASSLNRASTTGRSPRMPSRPPCRGSPGTWALPG